MSVESQVPVGVLVDGPEAGAGRILQDRPDVLHGVAVVQQGGGELLTLLRFSTLNFTVETQPSPYLAYLQVFL